MDRDNEEDPTNSKSRFDEAPSGSSSCWPSPPEPRRATAEAARVAAWLAWLEGPPSRPEQRPPRGDEWRTWALLGGRGSGKTRAGAEWLQGQARRRGRLALVGPTLHDAREVMIGGAA